MRTEDIVIRREDVVLCLLFERKFIKRKTFGEEKLSQVFSLADTAFPQL